MKNTIEVMDTTLRDGEQTTGVSFSEAEKLAIARLLLDELKVNRVEVASARVSDGEFRAVKKITEWAQKNNHLEQIEILGFVDQTVSLDWITQAGGKVVNLLTKGSLKHLEGQLRKTPEEHLAEIQFVLDEAAKRDVAVNVYLEDWSNGMLSSIDYVYYMVDYLSKTNVKRIMLPDTLGILNPDQTFTFCKAMTDRYPHVFFDFHAHNDYDFSVANVYMAVKAGISGIHTTINGLGERAGNAPTASVLGMMNDHLKINNTLNERSLTHVSRMVESFSSIRIPANKPLTGESVFTQCSGVHADGDNKDNLYFNELMPERFGRVRQYALGKTSGKANILKNLQDLGIELNTADLKKVTHRVIELGDKKESVSAEDLPYIISDVLKTGDAKESIKLLNYSLNLVRGMRPVASLKIQINKNIYAETAVGDGQYDAFMKALWKIYERLDKTHPVLADYWVSIPPGGKTDALVETVITWISNDHKFKTRGLDVDQTEAAIKATLKMLNIFENSDFKIKK
jgi:D-citramalate synthase